MSKSWDEFLPLVLPDLPGCPKALALAAVKRAAEELCRSAYVWIEEIGPVDVVPGQAEYVCPVPSGATPVILLGLFIDGWQIRAATAEEMDAEHPGWTELTASRPIRFLVPTPGKVRLVPEPTKSMPAALTARMALAPAQNAATVEDVIIDQWSQAVAHAAKAELLALPGKPWTQPQLAEHHARQFRVQAARARGRSSTGWAGATLSVRPRQFGS
jgi:hypothetical protein